MRVVNENYGDEWVICEYCEGEIHERPIFTCTCGAEVHRHCAVAHRDTTLERHEISQRGHLHAG